MTDGQTIAGITAVTTLISVSLGFASSQLSEWFKDRRAYEREQASRVRHVVEIYQLNDTSVKQVAKLAGISIPATKSRLSRAKAVLRGVLDSEKNGAMPRRSTQ